MLILTHIYAYMHIAYFVYNKPHMKIVVIKLYTSSLRNILKFTLTTD